MSYFLQKIPRYQNVQLAKKGKKLQWKMCVQVIALLPQRLKSMFFKKKIFHFAGSCGPLRRPMDKEVGKKSAGSEFKSSWREFFLHFLKILSG